MEPNADDNTWGVKTTRTRRACIAVAAIGVLTLTACGAPGQPTGPGRMGGNSSGYQYSRQTCTAPDNLPGPVITVDLVDMGMSSMMGGTAPMGARMTLRASATAVASGQVTFVVHNLGWRTHEFVILPLLTGSAPGQRVPGPDGKVDESGSLGEASANCLAGTGDGVPAGAVSWVTLRLPPGDYELVCNLTNHYANGMYQQFTVTGN